MLIFGLFEGERVTLDVPGSCYVRDLKHMIKTRLNIPMDVYKHDKKILVLTYAGADLGDEWMFTDLGIVPGTTIRIQMREEVKPVLFINCSHNNDTIHVVDTLTISQMPIDELRTLAAKRSGVPVCLFRLTTKDGKEMYDGHRLEDYGVDTGHTINLENWDGWNEFLNLCILGFTPQVVAQIVSDEVIGRFQMKVALFVSAHAGNVDLARSMLRYGIRSDEAVGEHPQRQWCSNLSHIESLKAPVHEATEMGQLGALRLFVNHDITCLNTPDGHGLLPLNIALRRKVKNCASYILTKQWSKLTFKKDISLNLAIYTKIKHWCDRAKERAYTKYGHSKSSLKRRIYTTGPLVSHGVVVDGFSTSPMTGKPKAHILKEKKRGVDDPTTSGGAEPEMYFKQLGALTTLKTIGEKRTKWGKAMDRVRNKELVSRASKGILKDIPASSDIEEKSLSSRSPATNSPDAVLKRDTPTGSTFTEADGARLPPILEKARAFRIPSLSQSNLTVTKDDQKSVKSDMESVKERGDKQGNIGRLLKSKGAYFSQRKGDKLVQSMPNVTAMTDRSDGKSKVAVEPSMTSASSVTDECQTQKSDDVSDGRRHRKRNKITSTLLLSKSKNTEGSIPLPLVSTEVDNRPFFYLNGLREEDFIFPVINLVTRIKGATARDRALESLSIANSFKDKTWLSQVRMALSLTSKSVKRNVGRMRGEKRNVAS